MDGVLSTETVPAAAPAPPRAARGLAGERIAGRYRLISLLGAGGSSQVFLAQDEELGRPVALKLLRGGPLGEADLARFRRQVRVAREAANPHLVCIHDLGRDGDRLFLTMEPVAGESLRQRLGRGPLPVAEAIRVTHQVLLALAALHRLGVVHRDVKPANLLLGHDGVVRLVDLGLARRWQEEPLAATATAQVVGTLDYLSPEQALGGPVDGRSDLYALGLVLYEMLAGEPPHRRETQLAALLARFQAAAPDLRRARPEAPRWLARFVARLVARRAEDRFASAEEALRALAARRVAGWRSRRRNRWRQSLAAAAAAAAIGVAAARWPAGAGGSHSGRFDRLVDLIGPAGIQALARDGTPLWEIRGVDPLYAVARLEPGAAPVVVGVRRTPNDDPLSPRMVEVREAQSGRLLRQMRLPPPPPSLMQAGGGAFADRFGPDRPVAMDLDADGTEEVLLAFHHHLWPSYTLVLDHRAPRPRLLFLASGHHRPVAAQDLDGDGRPEVLFAGVNNRAGWHHALAAVRYRPAAGRGLPLTDGIASTPDTAYSPDGDAWLLWYALLPPGLDCGQTYGCLEIEPPRRRILLRGAVQGPVSFAGFRQEDAAALPDAARRTLRQGAWASLREAQRLFDLGLVPAARTAGQAAITAARAAADPLLAEWAKSALAAHLAKAGLIHEAEERFRELARSPSVPHLAYTAGLAFHAAGDTGRAIAWYRQGFGPGAAIHRGRPRSDYLEGIVLALAEEGRWAEADEEIARFTAAYPLERDRPAGLAAFVRWRRGLPAELPTAATNPFAADLYRYWALEVERAHGARPEALLATLAAERRLASETSYLLDSFEAELQGRLGRPEEALRLARGALDTARRRLHQPAARAHYELLTDRFARLARERGEEAEAAAAQRSFAAWRQRRPTA